MTNTEIKLDPSTTADRRWWVAGRETIGCTAVRCTPYIVYGRPEFYRFAQIPDPLGAVLSLGPHLSPVSLASLVSFLTSL